MATISQELHAMLVLKLDVLTVLLLLFVLNARLATSFQGTAVLVARILSQPAASASTQQFVPNAILPSTSILLCSALPAL